MKAESGEIQVFYTKSGLRRFSIEIRHRGLHKYQSVRGDNQYVVQQKARARMKQWDEMWARKEEREERAASIDEKKNQATERSGTAQAELDVLDQILAYTLKVDDRIDWESLKDYSDFAEPQPKPPVIPARPVASPIRKAPTEADDRYQPRLGLIDRLSSARRLGRESEARQRFESDLKRWEEYRASTISADEEAVAAWEKERDRQTEQFQSKLEEWRQRQSAFLAARDVANAAIDEQKADYLRRDDPQAIVDYCDLVLSNSRYPDYFPQSYELDYNPESKLLLVDYQLPALSDLPTLREVRYIQSRDEFSEKHISQAQLNRTFDSVLYQVALRTIHELYEADRINALSSIVFNGYVIAVDPATGHESNGCILSIQAQRETFEAINLARVDPKECFKNLKGVASARLHTLTPVAPIVKMEREDIRFVEGYAVAGSIQEGDNLAAMDWEDFEHLIRELFEQEFSGAGGEVKVTRASRDGGVDAIVFDPDPLRGGKIIIQAKRYTGTVGVSAVRDLYGTLLNEGANKGILVTTSNYGADAYEFAKGKPLTLLNGANLLHLLERHGHKARIDLKEARELAQQ